MKDHQPTESQLIRNTMTDLTPGLGHVCIDLTRACTDLTKFLLTIQKESMSRFGLKLKLLESPKQTKMGMAKVEVAFIGDADGTVLELMRYVSKGEATDSCPEWGQM